MLFIGGALKRFDPELVACMQIRCRATFFFSKVLFLKIKAPRFLNTRRLWDPEDSQT